MVKLLKKYQDKFISKWLVLLMDLAIVSVTFLLATSIRFNFQLTYYDPTIFKYHLLLNVFIKLIFFFFYRTFYGIIRHSSLQDVKVIFYASFSSLLTILTLTHIPLFNKNIYIHIPTSILFVDFFIGIFGLIASRFLIKSLFENLSNSFKTNKEVIIYGSGNLAITTKNVLLNDEKNKYHILYFIDDNNHKRGKSLEGIDIISKKVALNYIVNKKEYIDIEIIFAIQTIESSKKNEIIEDFLDLGLKVRVVPPVKQWIKGQLSTNQIQQVKIEDLLERLPIQLNNRLVKKFITDKRIFITGAAGSIGSEIVRQLIQFKPEKVILIDQAESGLYDLETELVRLNSAEDFDFNIEIGDVTNNFQMEKLFETYRPDVIFHAAAYKHVPLMEANPARALNTNTLGTKNLADLAKKYEVGKFVFISTDKAVNPTNVMGATKRLSEMYVQSLNQQHANETRFIVTRFGNVLGSNGSVIPLFKKQIEKGGPVTVTDPKIIRYFMTIPEACQLVLEAGTMGKGGEIYVFDMGEPVKILDLAKRMIKLSGFEPFTQIPIEFTGLRAGEKLYEELLGDEENTIATHHPKIMVARTSNTDFDYLKGLIEEFEINLKNKSNEEIVVFLKKMVPEYVSNNSPFEAFDKEQLTSATLINSTF